MNAEEIRSGGMGPRVYCEPCNAVGMSNCGNFDECGEPRCITCKRKLAAPVPPVPQAAVAWVDVRHDYLGPYEFHGIAHLPIGRHDLYVTPTPVLADMTDEQINLQGWQPIATAPKTECIDLWLGDRRWTECYWDRVCCEWRKITETSHLVRVKNATHWMPIPANPVGNKA